MFLGTNDPCSTWLLHFLAKKSEDHAFGNEYFESEILHVNDSKILDSCNKN